MRLSALPRRPASLCAAAPCPRRAFSSPANPSPSFYRNRLLESYADKATNRLSLRQLVRQPRPSPTRLTECQVFYGRAMNEERLIKVQPLADWAEDPSSVCADRQLRTDRAARPYSASNTRHASAAIRRRYPGAGRKRLRGAHVARQYAVSRS